MTKRDKTIIAKMFGAIVMLLLYMAPDKTKSELWLKETYSPIYSDINKWANEE